MTANILQFFPPKIQWTARLCAHCKLSQYCYTCRCLLWCCHLSGYLGICIRCSTIQQTTTGVERIRRIFCRCNATTSW